MSLGTTMTQMNKVVDLNSRFASLSNGMMQLNKLKDSLWTLLFLNLGITKAHMYADAPPFIYI
jgi:hypothetical protein